MRLDDYLKNADITIAEFAETLGVTYETVRRYCRGEAFPRPKTLRDIEAATGGKVRAEDFLYDDRMSKRSRSSLVDRVKGWFR